MTVKLKSILAILAIGITAATIPSKPVVAQLTTIAQWGIPDRAGDIVTSTQFLTPPSDAPTGWTTYTPGNENNPTVGPDYYPNNTDRTPNGIKISVSSHR